MTPVSPMEISIMKTYTLTFDSNKKLTHITFNFVNNEKSTVPTDDLSPEIIELYLKEYNKEIYSRKKDRQFHSSLSFDEHDNYIETNSPHLDEQVIQFETHKLFESALDMILPEQKSLIYDIYFNKISAVDLAKKLNVTKSAISHRLGRAKTALKKQIKLLDPTYNYCS